VRPSARTRRVGDCEVATGFPGRLLLALLTPGGAAGDFS